MEEYDLNTAKRALKKGLITKEEYILISDFIKKRDKYYISEEIMGNYFEEKIKIPLDLCKNKSDLLQIKETLRAMPECVSKVLIFRKIIFKEETL